jgi:hypothetical protein
VCRKPDDSGPNLDTPRPRAANARAPFLSLRRPRNVERQRRGSNGTPRPERIATANEARAAETGGDDLARLRGKDDVTFGVWCDVVEPGAVAVGDAVEAV